MKFLAIAIIAAASAVYAINEEAEGKGKECCDRKPDHKPEREHRECPRPGDIDPKVCGLGRCECPDKCSALWFPLPCTSTTTMSATEVWSEGFGDVYCQDFFFTCDHECDTDLKDISTSDAAIVTSDYEVRSACIAFESIDRPQCFLPEAGCISSAHCDFDTTLVQLHGSNFSCIGVHSELLRPGCSKSCPKGYYPTCLLVKKHFNA